MSAPRPGPQPGDARALRAVLQRVVRWARAEPHGGLNGHAPVPESAWERAAEARLGKIEQQLNSQNRLLLVTLVSILADVALGLAR